MLHSVRCACLFEFGVVLVTSFTSLICCRDVHMGTGILDVFSNTSDRSWIEKECGSKFFSADMAICRLDMFPPSVVTWWRTCMLPDIGATLISVRSGLLEILIRKWSRSTE